MSASPLPFASLPRAAVDRLRALTTSKDPIVAMLVRVAFVLAATGAFHIVVWLLDGAPSLAGPVSWRKPIVFGVSSGITTLSLAWLASLLPDSAGRRRAAWTYAVTMSLEIALIDLQRWRGVASHFNNATALDTVIYNTMGGLIVTAAVTVALLGWQLRRAPGVDEDTKLAGLLGVAFLLLGSLIGVAISVHGAIAVQTGSGTPSMVGAAPMKIPHSLALHGLQVLPMLAWVLSRAGLSASERARLVVRGALGYGVIFAAALAQLANGRPPGEPVAAAVVLGVVGAALLASPLLRLAGAPAQGTAAEAPK